MPEGVKRNRFHPDDRVRATLSTCGRGACTYLQQSNRSPGTDAFLKTLAAMNEAIHGFEVEPAAAAEALRVASEFLAELRRLAAE
jgi:hypothetical protein